MNNNLFWETAKVYLQSQIAAKKQVGAEEAETFGDHITGITGGKSSKEAKAWGLAAIAAVTIFGRNYADKDLQKTMGLNDDQFGNHCYNLAQAQILPELAALKVGS